MGVPITIQTKAEFVSADAAGAWESERVIVVVETPSDLLDLARAGVRMCEANVGGLHHAKGKREVLAYVYVDDGDLSDMRELCRLGIRLEARDVPQSKPVDLAEVLNLKG
jgi:mannose/fructose/N-acetylgalactosamine-specific phosphotransferase system component IIB